ncbi:MAG: hypothetical protein ACTSPI_02340 [Candidatus Heimdallarchaeaceae archaeon]
MNWVTSADDLFTILLIIDMLLEGKRWRAGQMALLFEGKEEKE